MALFTFCKTIDCNILGVKITKMGPATLQFKLGRDFCTMHLPTKFHQPMFNYLQVIVMPNKHVNKQSSRFRKKTSTVLCYATPVENQTGK